MFDPQMIRRLGKNHERPLREMAKIEEELNRRFVDFEMPVRALILSVISGEPLLLVGPPGTAKSRLIRAFSALLSLLDEDHPEQDHPGYFEYLLTPFTEPGELFGFFDISKLLDEKDRRLVRDDKGMMQYATVVYLDEVFNASSAILNSLLAFLNERIFHDRGKRIKVQNLKALFAATNNVPQTPELRAVFDRFVLRCWVDNVAPNSSHISHLIQVGWTETYGTHPKGAQASYRRDDLLANLEELRKEIEQSTTSGRLRPQENSAMYDNLAQLVKTARDNGLSEMSNRRLVKIAYIHFLHHIYLYATRASPEAEELSLQWLVTPYFFDSFDPKDDHLRNNLRRGARTA
jgi:MoxR-like ATPase